jgi:hypothetical protein
VVQRPISESQVVYLRMEAKGLRSLPLSTRRRVGARRVKNRIQRVYEVPALVPGFERNIPVNVRNAQIAIDAE